MKSNNCLFLIHIPPPVHGSSVVGKAIKDSTLINEALNCNYINLLVSRTVDETGKAGVAKVLRFVAVWLKMLIKLIRQKPDICYLALTTTGVAFYKDVLFVSLLRLFKVKRVYHLHNKGVSKFQDSKIHSFFYHFVFKNADVIILSDLLYNDIEKYVSVSRVHICPNGIDETSDKNQELRINTNEEKPTILFLSNLIESKGIYVLLDACEILQDRSIEFECDFIGGEGDISAMQLNEMIAQKGLALNVNYLGKKYGNEKNWYFQKSDIFVLPTFYSNECFPLVLLEAMQYSLPVISTFEGGIPDIVEDGVTGYLVPQRDAEALADKLEVMIRDKALRQLMGDGGRIKYENEFILNKFENRLIEILNSVIKNNYLENKSSTLSIDQSNSIKGFLIFLIVLGHNHVLAPVGGRLFDYLYSFHIYGFFILPFLYKKTEKINKESLSKIIIRNWTPYIIFFFICCFIFHFVVLKNGIDLSELISALINGGATATKTTAGFVFLWFMPAYCAMSIIKVVFDNSSNSIKAIVLLIVLLLNLNLIFTFNTLFSTIPFAIVQGFYYFTFGYLTKLLLERMNKIEFVGAILFFVISLLYWFNYIDLIRYLFPLSGFLFIYSIRSLIKKMPFLIVIGKYSFPIYLLHVIIYNFLEIVFPKELLFGFVDYLLTIFISLIISYIMINVSFIRKLIFPRELNDLKTLFKK